MVSLIGENQKVLSCCLNEILDADQSAIRIYTGVRYSQHGEEHSMTISCREGCGVAMRQISLHPNFNARSECWPGQCYQHHPGTPRGLICGEVVPSYRHFRRKLLILSSGGSNPRRPAWEAALAFDSGVEGALEPHALAGAATSRLCQFRHFRFQYYTH